MTWFRERYRTFSQRTAPIIAGTLLIILLVGQAASAAPFCMPVLGGKPECIYDDAGACDLRAAQQGSNCIVNSAELTVPTVGDRYCSVDSERIIQCIYSSFGSCRSNIRNDSAFCFARGNTAEQRPDSNLSGAYVPAAP